MLKLITLSTLTALLLPSSHGYNPSLIPQSRRLFLSKTTFLSTTALATPAVLLTPVVAKAEPVQIKVTPLAHTFIVSPDGKNKVKPIRENDSTRILTNARVVLFFDGSSSSTPLARDIVDLTTKRKQERGPGVTPGNVKEASLGGVVDMVRTMDDGDCLLVTSLVSKGAREDELLVKEYAKKLGLDVGGGKSGGVVGVLLNGKRAPEVLEVGNDGGYTLLWYDV